MSADAAAGTGIIFCPSRYSLAQRRQVLSLNWNPPTHLRTSSLLGRPPTRLRNVKFVIVTNAVDSTQPSSSTVTLSGKAIVPDDDGFSITKYAELKPVPCITYADAQALRETCATPILKQVRDDVTRFRYGDEQHLDEALKRIFQYGLGGGIPRRNAPVLKMIREEVTQDGKYSLVLVFQAKALQLSDFEQRQAKFASFFGPGITAEVGKGENGLYEVQLISNTVPQ
ncbi:uncharacterized protein [Aristolochia californica]|uniref:uncharacterized protein isoform X2 n=1 Tax=Aristolochia californica TaxID=171875 RepID=UPI0035D9168D